MSASGSVLILAACLSAAPPSLPAEQASPPPAREEIHALKMSPTLDLAITGAGGAAWLAAELFGKKALNPLQCSWCDRDAAGVDQLGGFDRFGRGAAWPLENQKTAAKISDALAFIAVPASMAGIDALLANQHGVLSEAPNDLLIIAEAAVLSAVVNQTVKFMVLRERPFVHVLDEQQRLVTDNPHDNNLSFYSGHASFTFALATAAGTVAELRGYRNSWLVWAVGMPMAGATAYLRMAADKHYLTDVLVGAAVGSAFGVGVPLLLHSRTGTIATDSVELTVVPSANGLGVVGSF